MSFWTEKLSGQQPSNTRSLTNIQAWWAEDGVSSAPQPDPSPAPPQRFTVTAPKVPDEGACPGCFSGNYMAPSPKATPRCFDCGYPVVHSTSGMSVSKSTPHGKPVRQVLGDGFHGDRIVDRGL